MLKLTVLASENTDSNGQFFFIKMKLETKLTCNTGPIKSVRISETHEERQNKRVNKVEILTVDKKRKNCCNPCMR